MKKKILAAILIGVLMLCLLTGCSKAKTIRIANVDAAANTFDFLDTSSGVKIEYNKLIVDGEEVIDYEVSSGIVTSVMFATREGQIVREGNRTTFSDMTAYTINAELLYELNDGVLTITGIEE